MIRFDPSRLVHFVPHFVETQQLSLLLGNATTSVHCRNLGGKICSIDCLTRFTGGGPKLLRERGPSESVSYTSSASLLNCRRHSDLNSCAPFTSSYGTVLSFVWCTWSSGIRPNNDATRQLVKACMSTSCWAGCHSTFTFADIVPVLPRTNAKSERQFSTIIFVGKCLWIHPFLHSWQAR
jgi:hypothetical protein